MVLGFSACYRRRSMPLAVLLFLLAGGAGSSQPVAGDGDGDTLVAISNNWGSPPQLQSWNPAVAPDHCSWLGVKCDDASGAVVTGLVLARLGLNGTIPAALLCTLRKLKDLDLSNNKLVGGFPAPDLYACKELRFLDLSRNRFSGWLPRDIDRLSPEIEYLNLASNIFSGEFPEKVWSLPKLTALDLSNNLLTGSIPWPLDNTSIHFKYINMSSNHLTGEVPAQLQIDAFNESFLDNPGLCSRAGWSFSKLQTCRGGRRNAHGKRLAIIFIIFVGSIGIAVIAWKILFGRRREAMEWKVEAFALDLMNLRASDLIGDMSPGNLIGTGGSGNVYRVHIIGSRGRRDEEQAMEGSRMVAVKSLKRPSSRREAQNLEQQFEAEKILGRMRHRNIVRLFCVYAGPGVRLLVYEYMENGSLHGWLHGEAAPAPLDWPTRLSIAMDAARGLRYLHEDLEEPIVHCDVKSRNILLGPGFRAKIADLGLARKQGSPPSESGTFGYMAPEIRQGTDVADHKSDVFSFGVVLLELTTGKEATDGGDMDLAGWARQRYNEGAPFEDIVDQTMQGDPTARQAIQSVFTLAVRCTVENPAARPSMTEVLHQLTQCHPIAPETFPAADEHDEGAPLLQRRRRRTSTTAWIRQLYDQLIKPSYRRRSSSHGVQLHTIRRSADSVVLSFARSMPDDAARARTN